MKKVILDLSLILTAITFLASCGNSNSGPAEKYQDPSAATDSRSVSPLNDSATSSDDKSILDEVVDEYSDAVKEVADKYSDATKKVADEYSNAVKDAKDEFQEAYQEAATDVKDAMKDAIKDLF